MPTLIVDTMAGDAHVQDGALAGGEEVVAHEIALVHALEDPMPPAEGLLRTGRAGRAGVAALLEARQVAPTERPAAVVVFAARLVLAARLVREEVVGSFDVANHVLDGKAHLEQAARVAPRRPSYCTDPATLVRQAFAPLSAVPKAAFVGEEKGRRCRVRLATVGGAAACQYRARVAPADPR